MVKIFVMAHKKFEEPQNPIYIPLHVGKAQSDGFGYLGDDTGRSISKWNQYFGELTGVYWVWKNVQDADIVGICHYRRYFLNDDRQLLGRQEYEGILKDFDIIVSNRVRAEVCYQEYYAEAHNVEDLLMVERVIQEKYPEYAQFYRRALDGDTYYYGNLMVTSRELFQAYAQWLFDILFEVGRRIDVSSYDLYNQRVFGFLSEQMLKAWIEKNHLKVYEGTVGITAEKAETVEFKLAMGRLIKLGEIAQAREMFYAYLKLRPDIRLELSDIRGEIPIIEQLLYIAEQEQQRAIPGLIAYSDNLNEWIAHFCKVRDCLVHFSKGADMRQDASYIREKGVSWVMGKVILLNMPEELIAKADAAKVMDIFFHVLGVDKDGLK